MVQPIISDSQIHIVIGFFLLVALIALILALRKLVDRIAQRRRYARIVQFEGKVVRAPGSLHQRFFSLFVPRVRKKTQIRAIIDKELYQLLKRPIVLHVSPPKDNAICRDDKFHILLWASANQHADDTLVRPDSLLDCAVGGDSKAYKTSNTGYPIVDPLTGFVAGELFDNRLYIHVDVLNGGQKPHLDLLRAIASAARTELVASDTVKRHLVTRQSAQNVTVEGFEGRISEAITMLARSTLSPVVSSTMMIKNSRGSASAPVRDDVFHVFMHSAPTGKPSLKPLRQYWGFKPVTRSTTFQGSGIGRLILDTAGGVAGELVENNLYIHLQVLEAGSYTELALLKCLLDRVVEELKSLARKREDLTAMARAALPATIAEELVVHIDSPIARPGADGFHICAWSFPERASGVASRWQTIKDGELALYQPQAESQKLWIGDEDSPLVEIVDGNTVFINTDVWSADRHIKQVFPAAIARLGSELKAKAYLKELLACSETGSEGQLFNFADNGLSLLRKEVIERVVRHIVLSRVSQSVRLINCDGDNCNPDYNGEFSVFLDSSPLGRKHSVTGDKRSVRAFHSSRLGVTVLDEDGNEAGELIDDNLFLHSAPMPGGTYTEAAAFAKTLARAFDVRAQLVVDREQVASLANEILADSVAAPLVVHAGSRVVKHDDAPVFNLFFGDFRNNERPASSWWTATPSGLASLTWVGSPIIDEANDVVGEIVFDNAFLRVDLPPGSFNDRKGRLSHVLKTLKTELAHRAYVERVIEAVKAEDAALGAPPPVVHPENLPGPRAGSLVSALVTDLLAPRLSTEVRVLYAGGWQAQVRDDQYFYVVFQSAPERERLQAVPETIWGHRFTGGSETTFVPSPIGQPIVDEETGFVVGEIVGRNLFSYEDLAQRCTLADAALLTRFLLEARRLLIGGPGDLVSRQLSRECSAKYNAARVPVELTELQDARLELRKMLVQAQKDESYYYQAAPGADELAEEFDQLLKLSKVTGVEVSDNFLTVDTRTLYCTNPLTGTTHEIGAFKILLNLKDGKVNWKNKTRSVNGGHSNMQAPHVGPEGWACLGNTSGLFPDLIVNRELISAVELAIAFVESVNPTDAWGKHIGNWPVAYGGRL